MPPSRRILKEWLSESAQVVLMAAPEGSAMRREACPDDQYWLMLRGAWTNRSPSGQSIVQCAEGAHFRPATPCVRRALTDTLSLGVRLFHDAPIRQGGLARPSGFEGVLWPLAQAMLSGACPREDALDEAILPLLDARPSEGEARPPRWLAGIRDRLDAETAPTSLAELAIVAGVSPNHLSATFARHCGRSISRYRHERGLRRALRSLALPAGGPGEAALCGGFYDQAHFTRICRRELGLTPGQVARLLREASA